MSDIGIEVIDYMYRRMKVDDEWSNRHERGFTWWPGLLAQHVWADPPVDDDGFIVSRIHIRTDCLKDFPATDKSLYQLAFTASWSTTNGPIRYTDDLSRVQYATSAFVHKGNVSWLQEMLSWLAPIQATEVSINAETLSQLLHCNTDISIHPTSGQRDVDDDMLQIIGQVVAPAGREPSRWAGHEMTTLLKDLERNPYCAMATGDTAGLTAEFPYGSRTSLLQVRTRDQNPRMGSGVLVQLTIPQGKHNSETGAEAIRLNELEHSTYTRARCMGSWCPHETGLTYTSFFPNVLYREGLLSELTRNMLVRARWVAEEAMGQQRWEEITRPPAPALASLSARSGFLSRFLRKKRSD